MLSPVVDTPLVANATFAEARFDTESAIPIVPKMRLVSRVLPPLMVVTLKEPTPPLLVGFTMAWMVTLTPIHRYYA